MNNGPFAAFESLGVRLSARDVDTCDALPILDGELVETSSPLTDFEALLDAYRAEKDAEAARVAAAVSSPLRCSWCAIAPPVAGASSAMCASCAASFGTKGRAR